MRARCLFLLLGFVVGESARANEADAALEAFFAREWDYQMAESPLWASSLGDLRWNDRLGDFSLASIERRQRHDREALAQLRALPDEGLGARNRENREIFEDQLQDAVDGQRFPYELMPVNQQYSLPSGLSADMAQAPLDSVRHVEDYIARLQQVPRALKDVQEVLAEGARRAGAWPHRAVHLLGRNLPGPHATAAHHREHGGPHAHAARHRSPEGRVPAEDS